MSNPLDTLLYFRPRRMTVVYPDKEHSEVYVNGIHVADGFVNQYVRNHEMFSVLEPFDKFLKGIPSSSAWNGKQELAKRLNAYSVDQYGRIFCDFTNEQIGYVIVKDGKYLHNLWQGQTWLTESVYHADRWEDEVQAKQIANKYGGEVYAFGSLVVGKEKCEPIRPVLGEPESEVEQTTLIPKIDHEQIARDKLQFDLSVPNDVGVFETGCHTDTGNDLVLYLENTPTLCRMRDQALQECLKFMMGRRFGHIAFRNAVNGMTEKTAAIRFDGPIILNDAFNAFSKRFDHFIATVFKLYEKEIGPIEISTERRLVTKDVMNYLFRYYQEWIPEQNREKNLQSSG